MSDSSKADWYGVALTAITLLSVAFGGYGHFSSVMADKEARITVLEKEVVVATKDREAMDNELDVLWVDTSRNRDSVDFLKVEFSKAATSFSKFADAVDRLSVSVARLEEQVKIKSNGGVE